ncbi:rhodanese-like domain-containing protein [Luteolibacter yonseiensis]|uniref:Rhodanese-like domain-containing protein n=1 Tax=Luteolibacter yonseiensis TaxID=1144680 RepID=A0A934V8D5_9BACT|nr:rhodanese-like domain-containing protein [Luteolibacter yonseiensis]MBK1817147.1 rhodanese-like domain-containing protein [Luteolibacter yonseiensis]
MLRSIWLVVPVTLAMVSCATPVRKAHESKEEHSVKKTAPKPVRMNGRGKITSVSLTDAFTLQQSDKALILDARPGFFYGLGHLPGALSFPKSDCDALIEKHEGEIKAALAAKKTIIVYCTNLLCPDARTVATHLADSGYSSSVLTGGWESWKESGLPTE